MSVCPSVRLFPFRLLNQLTFELKFCMCMGHDPTIVRPAARNQEVKVRVVQYSVSVQYRLMAVTERIMAMSLAARLRGGACGVARLRPTWFILRKMFLYLLLTF